MSISSIIVISTHRSPSSLTACWSRHGCQRSETVFPTGSLTFHPKSLSLTGTTRRSGSGTLIHLVNQFLTQHPDIPVVADTGDCLFASVDIRANICVAPAYYATMGFAIPGAMGLQLSSGLRPLVLVGDGGFQMTGAEISQCVRYGLNPIVILFNNSRWEMLQAFFPTASYNDTVPWPFARLAELWGGRGFEVRTPAQLRSALSEAHWRIAFVSLR